MDSSIAGILHKGVVIPAHPLALTAALKLDERRQAALTRYYCDAGAGGIAVGVHTTQFAIRDRGVGLLQPVLRLAMDVLREASNDELIAHCRRVGGVIPLFGFYLQPAVGGRILDEAFWRSFLEIEAVVAIKVAPFDRYATLDVTRALARSGRTDVALYTGNDDAIVADLVTA